MCKTLDQVDSYSLRDSAKVLSPGHLLTSRAFCCQPVGELESSITRIFQAVAASYYCTGLVLGACAKQLCLPLKLKHLSTSIQRKRCSGRRTQRRGARCLLRCSLVGDVAAASCLPANYGNGLHYRGDRCVYTSSEVLHRFTTGHYVQD